MEKIKELAKSRKFWAAILGVLAVSFKEVLGLDPTKINAIGEILLGWLLAQGAVDTAKALKDK
jgi:hypothetical protein